MKTPIPGTLFKPAPRTRNDGRGVHNEAILIVYSTKSDVRELTRKVPYNSTLLFTGNVLKNAADSAAVYVECILYNGSVINVLNEDLVEA